MSQDEYSLLNSKHVRLRNLDCLLKLTVDQFIGLHGYLLVYSVASRQSFDMITIIRDKILNHLVCSLRLEDSLKLTQSREPSPSPL